MTTNHDMKFPLLVGDVGGTNARFGLLVGEDDEPASVKVYPCADFPGIAAAAEHYLSEIGGRRPKHGAIAVATTVTGDQVRMTNHIWQFSIEDTRRTLKFEQLQVVNDFTALAMALPHLKPDELRHTGGGEAVPATPIALLGPGTSKCTNRYLPASSTRAHPAPQPCSQGN